jgi:ATP-binding cassette subfamily B protein
MPGDAAAVKGKRLQRAALRRAWSFAHPYRTTIMWFLAAILASALLALVPPFAFKAIIDTAIPDAQDGGPRTAIVVLAIIVVVAALGDAGLAILQRWCSARIGEGLIYDLRVALFSKVQRDSHLGYRSAQQVVTLWVGR